MVVSSFAVRAIAAEPVKPFLLHLPGIGGHMRIDDAMTSGLEIGGVDAQYQIYDWTEGDPGLPALGAYDRNQIRAQQIADLIAKTYRADKTRKIILTSHSGGGGLAVWALEKLPEDVRIDSLLLLAPALSPQYDLSKALSHVKGKAYAFTSTLDPINGLGTRGFGTIDRIKVEAAGNVGFTIPESGDKSQYAKLIGIPYNQAWMRLGNAGDHIGTMNRAFARVILAPLLITGEMPRIAPTSLPANTLGVP